MPEDLFLAIWDVRFSLKLSSMCSATASHSPFGLYVFDPYHFFPDPGPRNDQCPCANLFCISWEYCPLEFHRFSITFIIFWISARICGVVNHGNFSTRIPLAPRRFDPTLDIQGYLQTTQSYFSMRQWTLGMDSSCPDTVLNRRLHRLLLLRIGLLSTKLSFAKHVCANQSSIYLELLYPR